MVIGLYVAMWPFHLENPSLDAFLLSGHHLKEISLGSSILLRYPWLFDSWRSLVLAGSNFGLWSFQLEIGNGLYDHWDGFRPSTSVHRCSFKTSTDFKHWNLIWFASYSEHIKFKCSFKTVFTVSKFLTDYHCLLHPKKLIKEAMIPLEVFTDHNWRRHIQDPKLPFGVCKKWELSRVHRTKQRGEKLAALIGKQSNVVKTPKEVARHKYCTLSSKAASEILRKGSTGVARSHLTAVVNLWDILKVIHRLTSGCDDCKEGNTYA